MTVDARWLAPVSAKYMPTRGPPADGAAAGAYPVAGIRERDAAGRHQAQLRQRRADILEIRRPQRRRREYLHDVGAVLVGVQDLRGREAPGRGNHVPFVARVDDVAAEH